MKKLYSVIFVVGAVVGLFCYRSFINNDEFSENQITLTEIQVNADVDLLISTLNEAYAGKEADPENFEILIQDLVKIKNQSLGNYDFFKKINEAVKKFPDGHLLAGLNSGTFKVSRTMASIPEDLKPAEDAKFKDLIFNDKKTVILKIPTFLIEDALTKQNILDTLSEKIKTADYLILDLRGNWGGYQDTPLKIGAILWGETYKEDSLIQYYHMPVSRFREWNNESVHKLYLNLMKSQNIGDINYRKELESMFADPETMFSDYSKEDLNLYLQDEMPIEKNGFAKPIYILVDGLCASACELMLEALEMHPYAVTVGTQTFGAIKYRGVGLLTLTESGVDVGIATSYVDYIDKRNIERKGYKPKIFLSENEDAMAKVISFIK